MIGTVFLALVYAAVLLAAGFVAGGWLAGVVRFSLDRTRLDPEVRYLVVLAVRPLVIVLAVVAALESLGVQLDGVIVVLGAAALSVGLSMRETLSNAAAGALLLSQRPWRTGDVVEAAGERGMVVDTTLFTTTLKTSEGVLVTLANRLVLDRAVRNHTRNGVTRLEIPVHDARPAALAVDALKTALADEPRLLAEPAADVRIVSLAPDGAHLLGIAWVKCEDAEAARSEILRRVAGSR